MGKSRYQCGYKGRDTAYADDLLSTTKNAAQLQRMADVVSEFCSKMGLQVSTTKLRRFILGTHGMKDDDIRGKTIVHKFQWESEQIRTQSDEPWEDNETTTVYHTPT